MLFGEEGQERLARARIVVAGAGGLGSPVALYLAAAGVGTMTLIDSDRVDISNLNRQVVHGQPDVGREKVLSAADTLHALNPDITVHAICETIGEDTVISLTAGADGIVDAMDNFPARYLLNRAALTHNIPLFHGGIRGWYGQATTILPGCTPCLQCIFPCAPPDEVIPVIGTTAGVIGTVQANEVLKFLLGTGDLLSGRLLLWDGIQSRMEEVPVEKSPCCTACGTETNTIHVDEENI